MSSSTPIFQLTGGGYIKAPDAKPVEGSMRLKFEHQGGEYRVVVSQDRDFNFGHSNYENTRGEALIQLDRDGLEALARTILKVLDASHPN